MKISVFASHYTHVSWGGPHYLENYGLTVLEGFHTKHLENLKGIPE